MDFEQADKYTLHALVPTIVSKVADHCQQNCRLLSAMLPTIVGSGVDHRQHQEKRSRKL